MSQGDKNSSLLNDIFAANRVNSNSSLNNVSFLNKNKHSESPNDERLFSEILSAMRDSKDSGGNSATGAKTNKDSHKFSTRYVKLENPLSVGGERDRQDKKASSINSFLSSQKINPLAKTISSSRFDQLKNNKSIQNRVGDNLSKNFIPDHSFNEVKEKVQDLSFGNGIIDKKNMESNSQNIAAREEEKYTIEDNISCDNFNKDNNNCNNNVTANNLIDQSTKLIDSAEYMEGYHGFLINQNNLLIPLNYKINEWNINGNLLPIQEQSQVIFDENNLIPALYIIADNLCYINMHSDIWQSDKDKSTLLPINSDLATSFDNLSIEIPEFSFNIEVQQNKVVSAEKANPWFIFNNAAAGGRFNSDIAVASEFDKREIEMDSIEQKESGIINDFNSDTNFIRNHADKDENNLAIGCFFRNPLISSYSFNKYDIKLMIKSVYEQIYDKFREIDINKIKNGGEFKVELSPKNLGYLSFSCEFDAQGNVKNIRVSAEKFTTLQLLEKDISTLQKILSSSIDGGNKNNPAKEQNSFTISLDLIEKNLVVSKNSGQNSPNEGHKEQLWSGNSDQFNRDSKQQQQWGHHDNDNNNSNKHNHNNKISLVDMGSIDFIDDIGEILQSKLTKKENDLRLSVFEKEYLFNMSNSKSQISYSKNHLYNLYENLLAESELIEI